MSICHKINTSVGMPLQVIIIIFCKILILFHNIILCTLFHRIEDYLYNAIKDTEEKRLAMQNIVVPQCE